MGELIWDENTQKFKGGRRGAREETLPKSKNGWGITKSNKWYPKLHSQKFKVATINVNKIQRAGLREEVENWMDKKGIAIAALQETATTNNAKEERKTHAFYFSGDKKGWNTHMG